MRDVGDLVAARVGQRRPARRERSAQITLGERDQSARKLGKILAHDIGKRVRDARQTACHPAPDERADAQRYHHGEDAGRDQGDVDPARQRVEGVGRGLRCGIGFGDQRFELRLQVSDRRAQRALFGVRGGVTADLFLAQRTECGVIIALGQFEQRRAVPADHVDQRRRPLDGGQILGEMGGCDRTACGRDVEPRIVERLRLIERKFFFTHQDVIVGRVLAGHHLNGDVANLGAQPRFRAQIVFGAAQGRDSED